MGFLYSLMGIRGNVYHSPIQPLLDRPVRGPQGERTNTDVTGFDRPHLPDDVVGRLADRSPVFRQHLQALDGIDHLHSFIRESP